MAWTPKVKWETLVWGYAYWSPSRQTWNIRATVEAEMKTKPGQFRTYTQELTIDAKTRAVHMPDTVIEDMLKPSGATYRRTGFAPGTVGYLAGDRRQVSSDYGQEKRLDLARLIRDRFLNRDDLDQIKARTHLK